MRRFPLAFLLVGVMGLLAAGGAVLGAFQAPTGVDLAVHNSAGETLLASQVVGAYTTSQLAGAVVSFSFTAPHHVTEKLISTSGKVEQHQSVTGSRATQVLAPLRTLLSINAFSAHGAYYDYIQSARSLVAPSQRAAVSGTVTTQVQLQGGYVVDIFERVNATQGTQHITETADYRLSRVDGWTRAHQGP
jgi:hypothetical protein